MTAKSQTEVTYEFLRSEVLNGLYEPGSKLKIDAVRAQCNASPGAVREALSRLTSDGLVVALPQRGFIVTPISAEDLADLTKVRIEIETRCLTDAIKFGDITWEGRIQDTLHQLKGTPLQRPDGTQGVNREWSRVHAAFHDALIDACGSKWWLNLRDRMFTQAERYRRLLATTTGKPRDLLSEHAAIAHATLDRDVDAACRLLRDHLQATADHLLASEALSYPDVAAMEDQ
ncbi:MAG: GntR family transcriptional regulator [Pseudomonadota bacterium]